MVATQWSFTANRGTHRSGPGERDSSCAVRSRMPCTSRVGRMRGRGLTEALCPVGRTGAAHGPLASSRRGRGPTRDECGPCASNRVPSFRSRGGNLPSSCAGICSRYCKCAAAGAIQQPVFIHEPWWREVVNRLPPRPFYDRACAAHPSAGIISPSTARCTRRNCLEELSACHVT